MPPKDYVPGIAVISPPQDPQRWEFSCYESRKKSQVNVVSHYTAILLALSCSSAVLAHDNLLVANMDLLF